VIAIECAPSPQVNGWRSLEYELADKVLPGGWPQRVVHFPSVVLLGPLRVLDVGEKAHVDPQSARQRGAI
jgi:hypothetical protein